MTELLEQRTAEEAEHRLNIVVGLLTVLRNGDETATLRAMEAASGLVEDAPDDPEEMREALSALRTEDEFVLQEMRSLGGGAATADAPTPGAALSARGQARPKGRSGKAKPKPGEPGSKEFERQHPRGRGGKWIQKGEGMKEQPSDRVKQLQTRLHELGFTVDADGRFGVHTEEAVKAFQRKYGLQETGKVDASTVETMRSPPPKTAQQASAEIAQQIDPKKKKGSSSRSGGKSGTGSRSGSSRSGSSGSSKITLNQNDKAGIEKFQRDHGLKVTGKLDDATKGAVSALNASSARKSRSSGSRKKGGSSGLVRRGDGMTGQPDKSVTKLQQSLEELGFELGDGGVDGRYGGDTEQAVRMLQRRYGLRVDGVVGPQTAKMIKRLIERQKKEAKDQGYLSADQQGNVSGRNSNIKESAALHTEEETVDVHVNQVISGDADALAATVETELEEARSIGGVANNAPGTIAGTTQAYGGWPGTVAQEQTYEKASLPFTHAPQDDVLFGHDPPMMPPGLRTAPMWQFARCGSCVHHDAKRLCMLYSAGTDLNDLCDSWYSLTPEDARGRIVGVLTARSELTTARESADGNEVARAKAHFDHAMLLLEASSVDDPEFEEVVHGLVAKGRPRAEAKEQAKTLLAKKRLHQVEHGVVGLALVESKEEYVKLHDEAEKFGAEDHTGAYWLVEATFTEGERKSLAKKGKAMGHGGFPIRNEGDLKNAIQAFGRAKNKSATKAFIIKRARALGKTDLLPDGWLQEATVSLSAPRLVEVKSSAYPDLDKSPKKNWVEKAGGLPSYIERIAKHLHYEKGMQIGRAIAVAVNVVKKMCASGELNFPGRQSANAGSRAEACAAVASWEKKKAGSKLKEALELVEAAEADEGRAPYLSLQESLEIVAAMELEESRHPMSFHFDPSLHPRNRTGQFREILRAVERSGRGAQVTLPGGVHVKKRSGGAFTVHVHGKRKSGNFNIDKVANSALKHAGFATEDDRSAIPFGVRTDRFAAAFDPGDAAGRNMGPDEYFWNYEFKFDLRDATRQQQEEVQSRFKAAGLKPDGFSVKHINIVEDVLGHESHARKSPYAPGRLKPYEDTGRKGGGATATRRDPGIGPNGEKLQYVAGLHLTPAQSAEREAQHQRDVAGVRDAAKPTGLQVSMVRDRPDEFQKGDRVILKDGREGIVNSKSFGGTFKSGARAGDAREAEYSVSTTDPNPPPGHHGHGLEYGVKHSQLRFHPDEIATRKEKIDKLLARAEKPPAKRAVPTALGPVTNNASAVPQEWRVEHGYGEFVNPDYTNPQEGDRVTVMSSSTGFDRHRGKKGVVVRNAYSSGASTLLDVHFDDGETHSISNQVLHKEGSTPFVRMKPGTNVEHMLYHYLSGKKPPANFPKGSTGFEQWSYKGTGKKDDRIALIRKLTGATLKEMALVLGWTPLAGHGALDDLALVESASLATCRLPVAELLIEARQVRGNVLVDALVEVLSDRLRKLAPDTEARLQEAQNARREAAGDAVAVARADGMVRLYETLGAALS